MSDSEFTMARPPRGNQFCCGKPVGCTNTSDGCSFLHHPWKLRNVTGHREAMAERQEQRKET